MKIILVPNKTDLQKVEIEIRTSMTLAQWKIIHAALKEGAKSNWSHCLASFMDAIGDCVEKLEKNLTEEVELK